MARRGRHTETSRIDRPQGADSRRKCVGQMVKVEVETVEGSAEVQTVDGSVEI